MGHRIGPGTREDAASLVGTIRGACRICFAHRPTRVTDALGKQRVAARGALEKGGPL
ncbi:MAG TPA: hypothetical protein PLK84_00290 [Syntrophales bacterium]|nr:hypothetical protein [Syntrophales bacterium]HQM90330.1 hypothetical protein [Syntrophales bacterium]